MVAANKGGTLEQEHGNVSSAGKCHGCLQNQSNIPDSRSRAGPHAPGRGQISVVNEEAMVSMSQEEQSSWLSETPSRTTEAARASGVVKVEIHAPLIGGSKGHLSSLW